MKILRVNPVRLAVYVLAGLMLSACATVSSEAASSASRRNVILFLGDGMGISTVTAARIYAGQAQGGTGEEYALAFESFPNVALVKTYNTDSQVPDSAGTMSAIMTGEKTRVGYISVGPAAGRDNCVEARANEQTTLLEQAEEAGFATGIISTARITHATPAATYAHVPNRDWEADGQLPEPAREAGCTDIARQLVNFPHGDGIDVILGGGRAPLLDAGTADPEYPNVNGARTDGANLINSWLAGDDGREYVWNNQQFAALDSKSTGQVMGLFEQRWVCRRARQLCGGSRK